MAKATSPNPSYNRDGIIAALELHVKVAKEKRDQALSKYQKKLDKWKKEAPKKFAEAVADFDGEDNYYHFTEMFRPPGKPNFFGPSEAERALARVKLMAADENGNIQLRGGDPIFQWELILPPE